MCKHSKTELGKTIMASGEYHLWYRCTQCQENVTKPGPYISKKSPILADVDFNNLPIFADYRPNNPPCAVCGSVGTELHHIAPKELFPETFEQWPKIYLCKTHHNEWHNLITIPLRKYRKQSERTRPDEQQSSQISPGLSQ